MQEPPPERPAAPAPVPQPSTADGEAARAAVREAEAAVEVAVARAEAAKAALDRAVEAEQAAKRGAWFRVAAIADRLRPLAGEGTTSDALLDELRELARQNGPDLAALRAAALAAENAAREAETRAATAKAALVAAQTRLDAAGDAWRAAKANADARAARLVEEHRSAMAVWQKRMDERNARVRAAQDWRDGILASLAHIESLEAADARALADARGAVTAAEGRLAGLAEGSDAAPVGDPATLRETIERLERDVEIAERAGREARSYREARAAWESTRERVEALTAEAARFEAMERALRPDGVVGRLAAGPLATLREVLAPLAPEVRVTDEWEVLIRDAVATLASRSEQWRAGAALAVALAAVSGVRFAILDDADVLVDETERRALIGGLVALRQHFDQVIVLAATSPEATRAAKAPRGEFASLVGVWRVLDGRVERVVEPPVPAATAA